MARHAKEDWSDAAIGARLRATRLALGLSQIDLCKKVGITANQYNPWEKGHSRPPIDRGIALCNVFDLTLDWLYFGDMARLPHDLAEAIQRQLDKANPPPPTESG